MTIWTIQEYASMDNQYGERVTQLLAPPPATPASASPSSASIGQTNVNITVTGTSISGSGFYDTPASMSAETCRTRIGATVSGGVTVNSVTYTDATHATLNISTVGATAGLKTVTITNPDGQSVGTAILLITGITNPSTTVLSSSHNPSVFGQSVTITATVSGGGGTPTGNVTFYDNGVSLGSNTLSGGVTTYNTSAFSVSSHSLTASYGGDSNFQSSTSSPLSQVVNVANTTTTLIASPNPAMPGQTVVFTATVSVVAQGAGTPTGSVGFFDGATFLGSSPISSGVATFNTNALTIGAHTITASYIGDSHFFASISSNLPFTVSGFEIFLPFVIK
jgi:hypothetical protein